MIPLLANSILPPSGTLQDERGDLAVTTDGGRGPRYNTCRRCGSHKKKGFPMGACWPSFKVMGITHFDLWLGYLRTTTQAKLSPGQLGQTAYPTQGQLWQSICEPDTDMQTLKTIQLHHHCPWAHQLGYESSTLYLASFTTSPSAAICCLSVLPRTLLLWVPVKCTMAV